MKIGGMGWICKQKSNCFQKRRMINSIDYRVDLQAGMGFRNEF